MIVSQSSPFGSSQMELFNLTFTPLPSQARVVTWQGRHWSEYVIRVNTAMIALGMSPECHVWLAGGGSGGRSGYNGNSGAGGGGGYTTIYHGMLGSGMITIGAGGASNVDGGESRVDMPGFTILTAGGGILPYAASASIRTISGGNGGCGGGSTATDEYANMIVNARGQGSTTAPFGDTINWAALCAGGGGGGSYGSLHGGRGGSNGADGGRPTLIGTTSFGYGGVGGTSGGGMGGDGSSSGTVAGRNASNIGGGGGGGGGRGVLGGYGAAGGNGASGAVVIRIPNYGNPAIQLATDER